MRASVLGAILLIVGFLLLIYDFATVSPFQFLSLPMIVAILMIAVGLWILATKFKDWVYEH